MEIIRSFLRGFGKAIGPRGGRVTDGQVSRAATDVIKEPPMQIDGRVMQAEEFVHYVESIDFGPPLPTRVFLHHTWIPRKEDWQGLTTILAMKAYYEKQLWQDGEGKWHEGWDAGPHLFVAEDGIWLFSDLRYDGVGVYGQNYRSRHVEIVGDYDSQLPSGATLQNTIATIGILHERLGLDITSLNFHRDFSTKTCPGQAIEKGWVIDQAREWIDEYRRSHRPPQPSLRATLEGLIQEQLVPGNPGFALAKEGRKRGLVGAISGEIPIEVEERAFLVQFFAEAIIVPVGQWDQVQSLTEFEKGKSAPKTLLPRSVRTMSGRPQIAAPPHDPYHYQGGQ